MIPYTSSVINALSKSNEFEIYAVVVNSGKRSYRNYLKEVEHIEYIEYPRSKLLKLIYKIYPARIIDTIKKNCENTQNRCNSSADRRLLSIFLYSMPTP